MYFECVFLHTVATVFMFYVSDEGFSLTVVTVLMFYVFQMCISVNSCNGFTVFHENIAFSRSHLAPRRGGRLRARLGQIRARLQAALKTALFCIQLQRFC